MCYIKNIPALANAETASTGTTAQDHLDLAWLQSSANPYTTSSSSYEAREALALAMKQQQLSPDLCASTFSPNPNNASVCFSSDEEIDSLSTLLPNHSAFFSNNVFPSTSTSTATCPSTTTSSACPSRKRSADDTLDTLFPTPPANLQTALDPATGVVDKKTLKRMRNTESARRSREKKASTMQALQDRVSCLASENALLKQKLAHADSQQMLFEAREATYQAKLESLALELAHARALH